MEEDEQREPAADVADQVANRAEELVFTRRHRLRTEFVLQAANHVAVARTIGQQLRHEEHPEALRSRSRAFGPGQREVDIGPGVRAEPLLAGESPFAVDQPRDAFIRTDIAAAGAFGAAYSCRVEAEDVDLTWSQRLEAVNVS